MIIKYIIFFTKDKLFTRLIQFLNHKKSREKQLGPPFLAARKRVIIPLGLLRVAALNPLFSGCVGSTDATDRPERANSLCVLPPGNPKGERQNVVIPSKNRFFDGQTGPPFLAARRASGGVPCFVFAFTRSPAYARLGAFPVSWVV